METIIKFITVLAWVAVVGSILTLWSAGLAFCTRRALFAGSEAVLSVVNALLLLFISVVWIITVW